MKIQLIQHKKDATGHFSRIIVSPLNSPNSLDEFDIDIIDLTAPALWRNKGDSYSTINDINDFKSIQKMVEMRSKATILYILPTNQELRYYFSGGKFVNTIQIKDKLVTLHDDILSNILPKSSGIFSLVFEPTNTTVGETTYPADFFFSTQCRVLTKSNQSDKATTIELRENGIYATTLQITDLEEHLLQFVHGLFCPKQASPEPEWMNAVTFFDDDEQKRIIDENHAVIISAGEKITDAELRLQKNAHFKAILYTSGNELVKVVFEILEALLDCDLSDFIDEKREDFRIEKEVPVFIGEIKGVSTNVKNEHVSQVDVHYQKYIDELPEGRDKKDVHQSLIINPFRSKPITERDPVDEQQIKLAKRNGCLIIKTETLLKIYEAFLKGQIKPEKCIEVFSSRTGLLDMSDFG